MYAIVLELKINIGQELKERNGVGISVKANIKNQSKGSAVGCLCVRAGQ